MSSWHSYPHVKNLGHAELANLLSGDVYVEEKVDGSQFSFGVFPVNPESPNPTATLVGDVCELRVRSRGAVMHPEAPQALFKGAVEYVRSIVDQLRVGWTYRGEVLQKPHHNALTYDRVPAHHIILFDINTSEEGYLPYDDKRTEADRLGLETVRLLYEGRVETIEQFRRFLDTPSTLGGQLIEGVVVKPVAYDLFGRDKKCLFGKFVSEAFKEVHKKTWGESNPSMGDILQTLIAQYGTQTRWQKALQHLREAGQIEDDVRDIGKLIMAVAPDVQTECEAEIKAALWKYAWPHVKRGLTRGLPEWYKELLLTRQFEQEAHPPSDTIDAGLRMVPCA